MADVTEVLDDDRYFVALSDDGDIFEVKERDEFQSILFYRDCETLDDWKGLALTLAEKLAEVDADSLERFAFMGARNCREADKSDWIRIWAKARKFQGKSADSETWKQHFGG